MNVMVNIPDQVFHDMGKYCGTAAYDSFIVSAIQEYIDRQNLNNILKEGYLASRQEDAEICRDFSLL